jgi:hypothetical protein
VGYPFQIDRTLRMLLFEVFAFFPDSVGHFQSLLLLLINPGQVRAYHALFLIFLLASQL